MSLPDEMRQLTEHLLKAHEDRMTAVAGIRENTATDLAGFQEARQAMSVQQQQRLRAYIIQLQENVQSLRHEAALFLQDQDAAHRTMAAQQQQQLAEEHIRLAAETEAFLVNFGNAHQMMAVQQQAELKEYMDRLGHNVDKLRSETTAFMEDLNAVHQAMAVQQSQQLTEGHVILSAETAAFLNALDTAHQTMTSEQQQELSEYLSTLKQNVDKLRHNALVFVEELGVTRQAMADEQRQCLSEERTRLALEMAEMRGKLQAAQNELRAVQDQARHIWNEFTVMVRQQNSGEQFPVPVPITIEETLPPVEVQPAEKPAPEQASPDDLTVIVGIGAGMQKRLNEAGIHTWAQLAASTPERLREVLGGVSRRLAKVEEWIEQSRELQKERELNDLPIG